MIAAYVKDKHWDQWLPEFRFVINTAWQESITYNPAEMALGRNLICSVKRMLASNLSPDHPAYARVEKQEALFKTLRDNMARAQGRQAKYYNHRHRAVTYEVGNLVWIQHKEDEPKASLPGSGAIRKEKKGLCI